MERITEFSPAYDKRDPDPRKDYGINAMTCRMVLKGEEGAIHFVWSTGIFLEKTTEEMAAKGTLDWKNLGDIGGKPHYFSVAKAMGYDVGYHSKVPLYEGQEVNWPAEKVYKDEALKDLPENPTPAQMDAYIKNIEWKKIGDAPPNCDYLGVPCYCDGSAIRGDEWLKILVAEGSDKIWEMMEEDYKDRFEHHDD